MKYLYPALLILFTGNACIAQFKVTHPDSSQLPKGITYKGDIVNTAQWTDNLGDNIVILTETGGIPNDNGSSDAELYALHYLSKKDPVQFLWKIYDFTRECPVDIKAEFVKNTFAVTDLNHNGIAEIWMMYKVVCHGDVSPVPMKIIMYEEQQKFAARGNTKVKVSATGYAGGDYSFDDAFKSGPVTFRQYVDALWQKHKIEDWK